MYHILFPLCNSSDRDCMPDSKVHGSNMGPIWVLSAPDGPHVGLMNLVIRGTYSTGCCNRFLQWNTGYICCPMQRTRRRCHSSLSGWCLGRFGTSGSPLCRPFHWNNNPSPLGLKRKASYVITGTSHGHHVVSNHRQIDCLFNKKSFRLTVKETSTPHIAALNFGGFPSQRASYAGSVSMVSMMQELVSRASKCVLSVYMRIPIVYI